MMVSKWSLLEWLGNLNMTRIIPTIKYNIINIHDIINYNTKTVRIGRKMFTLRFGIECCKPIKSRWNVASVFLESSFCTKFFALELRLWYIGDCIFSIARVLFYTVITLGRNWKAASLQKCCFNSNKNVATLVYLPYFNSFLSSRFGFRSKRHLQVCPTWTKTKNLKKLIYMTYSLLTYVEIRC